MSELKDLELECPDCHEMFTVTIAEQEWYKSKVGNDGKPFDLPKRCKSCRAKRKAQRSNRSY